jgi:hypothetical protein
VSGPELSRTLTRIKYENPPENIAIWFALLDAYTENPDSEKWSEFLRDHFNRLVAGLR